MQRLHVPKEAAAGSHPGIWNKYKSGNAQSLSPRKRQKLERGHRGHKVQAVLQQDRRRPENANYADAANRPEVRHQTSATTAAADTYVPLNQAQDLLSEVVDASSPTKPVLLWFCESSQQAHAATECTKHALRRSSLQELRFLNYGINGTLLGLSTLLAASQLIHPGSAAASPNILGALKDLAQQGSQFYEYFVDVHPIATKAIISGTVYGLGDFTAQTYEGRSWKDFDNSRIIRSALIGFLAHGPLSHFFYEKLDRLFIISKYFDGGDAWFTPIAKILVDQTAFAASWNTLYYLLLGALKWESPEVILRTIKSSWWEMLKAGWRIWPVIHLITYTLISCQDRLLWVDMCELAWVTVLSYYGQQRRERAGAAACALPGVAGEGGIFTEDILRGMTVESQITFQAADGEPIVKKLDEVMVEAALLEANFGSSLDGSTSFNNPIPLQSLPPADAESDKQERALGVEGRDL